MGQLQTKLDSLSLPNFKDGDQFKNLRANLLIRAISNKVSNNEA
jgi:hypothetical protein